MPTPLGFSVLSDRLVVIVNPGTTTEWRFSNGGESPVKIVACKVTLRKGKDAQAASMKLVDYSTADWWRKLTFGTRIKVLADGVVVFSGTIATRAYWTHGAPVGLNLQLVGRTSVLYSDVVAAANTYLSQTTAFIANDLIATVFPNLTRNHITVTDGFVVEEFDVSVGDNVGDLLERLTKMDGFVYDVDELDDAHYYYPQAQNQGALTDDDLRGRPDEVLIEDGVIPPRNIVRILGMTTGGYVAKTVQAQHDSYYTQDASTKWVAQKFYATASRLSGADLFVDRSASPNQPSAMSIAIQTNALLEVGGVTASGSGTFAMDATTKRVAVGYAYPSLDEVFFKYVTFFMDKTGTPNNPTIEVRADNGGVPGALLAILSTTAVLSGGSTYKVTSATLSDETAKGGTGTRIWAIVVPPGNTSVSNFWSGKNSSSTSGFTGKTSTDGGSSWNAPTLNTFTVNDSAGHGFQFNAHQPSGTSIEFGDDISFGYTDAPYPPQFAVAKFYAAPKLILTVGTPYWILFKVSTASASVFWKYAYWNGSPSDATLGRALTSADSGSNWSQLGHYLAFHLYWASGPVDVTTTNTRAKLTAGVTNATTTFPVDRVDDFTALPKLCDVTTSGVVETVNVTARSTTTGAGTLTVQRAQAGTSAAAHNSGDYVNGDSIRTYGPFPYTAQDDTILDNVTAAAVAGVVLANHQTPASRLKLPLRVLRADLTVRNLVTVQRRFLDFNQALEVVQLDHEWTEDGNAFTTVQVGALDYDAARAIEQLRQEVHA